MNAGISRRTMIKGMAAMGGAAGLAMMAGCSSGSGKGEGALVFCHILRCGQGDEG